ncbi:MAG TPA: sodium-translocating pyrophosphatase, partial [Egibacteraceae bacterium]
MDAVPYISAAAAIAGLVLAFYFFGVVRKASPGTPRMVQLMAAIQEGARAFLRREYQAVAVFVLIMAIIIGLLLPDGWLRALAFVVGAVFSALAGFVGMTVATMANARTAEAAKTGPQLALPLAFRGGAVMGFTVAGLALLGVSVAYIVFVQVLQLDSGVDIVTAYSLGGSSIALFARIGGGIYTKAADVGADLVGKVEAGIPEDDPRNPATIADNVGDNVGDVAGMGADLFESYAGSIVAPIALAGLAFADQPYEQAALLFPLAIAAFGMLAAILGAFLVKTSPDASGADLARALHRGTNVAAGLTVVLALVLAWWLFGAEASNWWGFGVSVIAGLAVGVAIGRLSEYYTSDHYKPVKRIAASSETGSATNILGGIATGKMSVAGSVVLVAVAIAAAYAAAEYALPDVSGSGVYGVAVAGIGMLATLGVVVATDAYGPIADNAGGIAEMAHLDPSVREVTDELDALGNTTAAIAKGFAIGSAVLTALALFVSFQFAVQTAREGAGLDLSIANVEVFIGLFVGAMLPFLFAALTMSSVGRAANQMIEEVRRQFASIPGLREGKEGVVPDYARCVDISTRAALREMLLPGALAVVVPLVVGFISVEALGGLLGGVLVTGFAIAIYMANAGG